MKEAFEKIIERLEESSGWSSSTFDEDGYSNDDSEEIIRLDTAIEIVNQVAEEYGHITTCYLQSPCEYQNKDAKLPLSVFKNDDGWIPCSERLPEEKGDYLVTCNDGKVRVWWFVVEEDFKCWLGGVHQLKPIAWQPLPESYKPKENKND